nr:hypothetical protein [uncultured Sphaerochaeta sp.]
MKIALNTITVLLILLFVYLVWPEKVIEQAPGILVPDKPHQIILSGNEGLIKEKFLINKLAEYKLDARVLSKEYYYFDGGSVISPLDLALGWGPMSDQSVVDQISVSQGRRWYHWQADRLPIPKNQIMNNSANVHIIPADDYVEDKLDDVAVGNIIHLEGYLVKVIGPDGFKWSSSLSRTDKGDGACELFYVQNILILK